MRAQRNADADFRDALGDEIGKDAIQADRGEQQRQDRKRQHQGGAEALTGGGLTQDLLHGEDVVDGQTRIERGNLPLNRDGERERVACRANYNRRLTGSIGNAGQNGEIHGGLDGLGDRRRKCHRPRR